MIRIFVEGRDAQFLEKYLVFLWGENRERWEILQTKCFEGYEKCVAGHVNPDGSLKYISPNRKAKIYAYIESFKKSRKETERFKNKKISSLTTLSIGIWKQNIYPL